MRTPAVTPEATSRQALDAFRERRQAGVDTGLPRTAQQLADVALGAMHELRDAQRMLDDAQGAPAADHASLRAARDHALDLHEIAVDAYRRRLENLCAPDREPIQIGAA